MRLAIALLACVACGRVGFDASGGDGGGPDDDDDGGSGSGSGSGSDLGNSCVSPGYGDGFDEVVPCQAFGSSIAMNGGLATSNSHVTLTPNANALAQVGCVHASAPWTAAGVFLEVSGVPPSPTQLAVVVSSGATTVGLAYQAGTLSMLDANANTVSTGYDPVAMRWWRLRPKGTGLLAETSPDGKTWNMLGESMYGIAGPVTIEVIAQTVMTETNPGTATLESIDICPL